MSAEWPASNPQARGGVEEFTFHLNDEIVGGEFSQLIPFIEEQIDHQSLRRSDNIQLGKSGLHGEIPGQKQMGLPWI